ncbi:MAG TPA: ATP-binding protein, partial [Sphingomicrobium sp.]|nr:ATP-binding protein [Sphingomicrobium sp.]
QNEWTYDHARTEQTQALSDILAASSAAAIDFDDPAAVQQAVNAFRTNNQIRRISIFRSNGRLIAGYRRGGGPIQPTIAAMAAADPHVIRVVSPVVQSGVRIGTVVLDIDREAPYRRLSRYLVLAGLFVLAALVVASIGLAQAQLRRANRELENRAEALAQANVLLEEQMDERAKAEDQLRQSQKMQALGQLTGGIAHDFNNQLTVIQGSADILTRPTVPEEKRIRFAQAIVQAATNAASLTSQLLAFARRQPLKPERIDLNALVSDMRDMLDRTMGERIRIVTDLQNLPCRIEADRAQLQSAILNIASNARDAMRDGGTLTIRTRDAAQERGSPAVALDIEDNGSGMAPEVVDRIFEPFFTTKETGSGTGLGLSQVYGFASQSGGEVRARSEAGKGSTISLILPCVDSSTPAEPETRAAIAPELPPARILVVEDNEDVGNFAETLLSELGHDVTRATSGEQALEISRQDRFDIVLSDVVMPGMGGLKLADILAQEQPSLPVILATGYSEEIAERGGGGRTVILKPYRLATLAQALAEAMGQARRNERPDATTA